MPVAHLWTHAPELKLRARRQALALRHYQAFGPLYAVDCSADIGTRAGKLFGLREMAYDRLEAAKRAAAEEARRQRKDATACPL